MADPVSSGDVAHVIAQQGRYDQAIAKEFSLVADRMTWLVISQSFLMSAFVLSSASYDHAGTMKRVLGAAQVLMPVLGIALAVLIIVGVRAAHSAVHDLKARRRAQEESLPSHLRIVLIDNSAPEHDRGNWPPIVIPWVVLMVWAILLAVIAVIAMM